MMSVLCSQRMISQDAGNPEYLVGAMIALSGRNFLRNVDVVDEAVVRQFHTG